MLLLSTATSALNGFRADEVECEEAVAYLKECCSDLGTVQCDYEGGCNGHSPNITPEQSECIRARSCAELVQSKICDRVRAQTQTDPFADDESGGSWPPVCP